MNANQNLEVLEKYLLQVPGINSPIGKGHFENGNWWVKFSIDINHHLAWQVVQELGYVLNYVSVNERLPTVFMPVSPPPYMNGGPKEFLSWVIEAQEIEFTPSLCVEWLEGRLPRPVEDIEQWEENDSQRIAALRTNSATTRRCTQPPTAPFVVPPYFASGGG